MVSIDKKNIESKNIESFSPLSSSVTRWIAPIARWSVWQEFSGDPDVKFIGASLRRRLSRLAKMSLKVANDCAGDINEVRLVYASQHGDLNRTTEMLKDLVMEQPLSPTSFSMSVLNAFSGVYSIHKQDQSPSISISSGTSSFGFGLLEACLQLQSHPEMPVLFVYSDEPVPDVYGVSNEKSKSHAIAILLSKEALTKVICEATSSKGETESNMQSHSFIDCLNGKSSAWQGDDRVWTWTQCEK